MLKKPVLKGDCAKKSSASFRRAGAKSRGGRRTDSLRRILGILVEDAVKLRSAGVREPKRRKPVSQFGRRRDVERSKSQQSSLSYAR